MNISALGIAAGFLQRLPGLWRANYLRSVGAQALVSAFHFALNIFLVRHVPPWEYGIFAFTLVLAMFATAVNNALVCTPMTVNTPVIEAVEERRRYESMFATLNTLLFVSLLLLGWLSMSLHELGTPMLAASTLYIAMYTARQFSRSLGYARLRPLATALGDTLYVVSGLAGIAALLLDDGSLTITHVLLTLAAANMISMLVEMLRLDGIHRSVRPSLSGLSIYRTIWPQARWALLGALTTLFLGQAHGLIINSVLGPASFAPLAAGFVLFGPVRVALLTWQNMTKPELALLLRDGKRARVRRRLRHTTLLITATVLLVSITLAICWPLIYSTLYAKQYADAPMGMIVTLWALVTLCAGLYCAPSAALQALRKFRLLALASVYGALISGVLVSLMLFALGAASTLFGVLVAELFVAVLLTRHVNRQLACAL